MGKYLNDRYLDSVLESYFTEAESTNKFNNKKDVINYILKIYKSKSYDEKSSKRSNILIDFRNGDSDYSARNIWIDDLGAAKVTAKDIENIINKNNKYKNKSLNNEYIGYMEETNDESNNNEEVIEYINGLSNLILLAHDGGGTEFSIDEKSKKIYLYDHDYEFIPIPLSINDFVSLCKNSYK
jgi:hypothetical protein